ncbi:MAG: hypothetical protein V3U48_07515 [Rhodospirillales bacterium]
MANDDVWNCPKAVISASIAGAGFRARWWTETEDPGVNHAGAFEVGLACYPYAPSATTMELSKSSGKPPKVFCHKSPQYLALLDRSQAE